jgi:hypothetical protein
VVGYYNSQSVMHHFSFIIWSQQQQYGAILPPVNTRQRSLPRMHLHSMVAK